MKQRYFTIFLLLLALTFSPLIKTLSSGVLALSPASVQSTCFITYSQDFNKLEFYLQWSDGHAVFYFDDGSSIDLVYRKGWARLPHYYPYNVGGTRTFHPWLSIDSPDGQVTCNTTVEIVHYTTNPVCSIEYDQNFNHLTYYLNSSDGPTSFSFGDGSMTWVANGAQTVTHDYTYNTNGSVSYTPILRIYGPNGEKTCLTSAPITITSIPSIPPTSVQPTCSIVYTQEFNNLNFTVEWSDGAAIFYFDDGSQLGLIGTSGSSTVNHSYAYNEGGHITYHPWLAIEGSDGPVSCNTTMGIGD